jgi:chemotaxis protein histidine kinase CheA
VNSEPVQWCRKPLKLYDLVVALNFGKSDYDDPDTDMYNDLCKDVNAALLSLKKRDLYTRLRSDLETVKDEKKKKEQQAEQKAEKLRQKVLSEEASKTAAQPVEELDKNQPEFDDQLEAEAEFGDDGDDSDEEYEDTASSMVLDAAMDSGVKKRAVKKRAAKKSLAEEKEVTQNQASSSATFARKRGHDDDGSVAPNKRQSTDLSRSSPEAEFSFPVDLLLPPPTNFRDKNVLVLLLPPPTNFRDKNVLVRLNVRHHSAIYMNNIVAAFAGQKNFDQTVDECYKSFFDRSILFKDHSQHQSFSNFIAAWLHGHNYKPPEPFEPIEAETWHSFFWRHFDQDFTAFLNDTHSS